MDFLLGKNYFQAWLRVVYFFPNLVLKRREYCIEHNNEDIN